MCLLKEKATPITFSNLQYLPKHQYTTITHNHSNLPLLSRTLSTIFVLRSLLSITAASSLHHFITTTTNLLLSLLPNTVTLATTCNHLLFTTENSAFHIPKEEICHLEWNSIIWG